MGGPRSERAERYFVTDTALDPVEEGEFTLNSGAFKMKDSIGVFDPRSTGGQVVINQAIATPVVVASCTTILLDDPRLSLAASIRIPLDGNAMIL